MKHLVTPWRTRLLRNFSMWLGVFCLLPLCAACVTQGTYNELRRQQDQTLAERKKLAQRIETLSRQVKQLRDSNQGLDEERGNLIDELETLRSENEVLRKHRQKLQQSQEELTSKLSTREMELAKRESELNRLKGTYKGLVEDLESEVAAGQIQIQQLREGVRLNLPQNVLFEKGSAQLSAQGLAVLRKVADKIKTKKARVEVRGHTDNLPIRGALKNRYPSNWELAGARAASVVRVLEAAGVASNQLTAVSKGAQDPIASNATEEGRAKNRRIEIRLLNLGETPAKPENVQASATVKETPPAPVDVSKSVQSVAEEPKVSTESEATPAVPEEAVTPDSVRSPVEIPVGADAVPVKKPEPGPPPSATP